MIWLDVTRTGPARHVSGLTRVTSRLREELGSSARPCEWRELRKGRFAPAPGDWYLTAEVFSPAERPGFTEFVERRACRLAGIFHDAIPLKHPSITWPRSVARHPAYLTLLHRFDLILAVSDASRLDLLGFWRWQSRLPGPAVERLALGADFSGGERRPPRRTGGAREMAPVDPAEPKPPASAPVLLSVGILEPRKNPLLLLEVAEALWAEGVRFELQFAGRVNPHFGKPIARRIRALARAGKPVRFRGPLTDGELASAYRRAFATLVPSRAEGCGLPLLESLWHGVPCLCSDLPPLLESAAGGGCLCVPEGDIPAWTAALRRVLAEPGLRPRLADEAARRPLPTWAEAARSVAEALGAAST
ncbi:MAG: glycosyltransferase [Opitutaceae bacterium]